jgi:hypothetical protein
MRPPVKRPGGTLCDGDTAALVLDGANAICDRAPSPFAHGVTIAATLAFAAVWALAPVRWRRRALVLGCALSVPGVVALAWHRGDAPAKVATSSAHVARLEGAVRQHAQAHGCAVVERNECEACQPVLHLALAHAGPCESGATVTLGADALEGTCITRGPRLLCGAVGAVRAVGAVP